MQLTDRDAEAYDALFAGLAAIGAGPAAAGWNRFAWTEEDRAARAWFTAAAEDLALTVQTDRNGNLWAWWGDPAAGGAVATGSHLDTVPGGGAYDGALGVVAGLAALGALRRAGFRPRRPLAVAAFAEEEGARFGVATAGSRLMVGTLDPAAVRDRCDAAGTRLGDALRAAGVDEHGLGADPQQLGRLACYVELHVEQGRALADLGAPVAIGEGIWPHGRWRLDLRGEANHAGTTRLTDRHDPVVVLAAAAVAARAAAGTHAGVATVGRVLVQPNATNAVPAAVTAWLDARCPDDATLDRLLADWRAAVAGAAAAEGVAVELVAESRTQAVDFDERLRDRLAAVVAAAALPVVHLPTAAGHDAAALADALPTGMLFVRNPSGVSHSPREGADRADCLVGVRVLADVLADLAGR